MTIDEAIKINQQVWFCMHQDHRNEEEDALKLGIEALIRERNNRINPGDYWDIPLPSETKDK